ncbi:hypothetical protein CY34DRAFT_397632 [Suillus luteus UH-Slu-Lm8-n1]|uniref:Uncharacterized protein n=1 Tax=Suillus luteus UH-Slu-Lm8-n1 TaxID=930992 RepID=A0A0D0A9B0_9AGAM|nr:hypothetical protein CY34DRAFT_397632 [Suillus luteus UH-Slu-Lm8-n1]
MIPSITKPHHILRLTFRNRCTPMHRTSDHFCHCCARTETEYISSALESFLQENLRLDPTGRSSTLLTIFCCSNPQALYGCRKLRAFPQVSWHDAPFSPSKTRDG